jgi:hypothetical protein
MTTQKYCDTLKTTIGNQLKDLSKKYNIKDKDVKNFMKSLNFTIPLRKKTILSYEQTCKARKQDGGQCSRRHKPGELFCGKHIHNQKYGIYKLIEKQDNKKIVSELKKKSKRGRKPKTAKKEKANEFLTLKSVQIKNKYYYIDKYNILYNPEPINGQYEIIGKLQNGSNNDIYYATSAI